VKVNSTEAYVRKDEATGKYTEPRPRAIAYLMTGGTISMDFKTETLERGTIILPVALYRFAP
jgi:hypothetical protein